MCWPGGEILSSGVLNLLSDRPYLARYKILYLLYILNFYSVFIYYFNYNFSLEVQLSSNSLRGKKKKKCHWNALTMFSAAAKSRPVYYWWSLEGVSPVTCNLSFNLISVPMKAGSSLLESFQPYSIDIFIHTLLKRSYIIHREKQSKWRENSGLELRLSGFWMDAIPIILGRGYDTLKIYNATLQKPSLCFSHSDRAEFFRTLSKMETSVYEIVSL